MNGSVVAFSDAEIAAHIADVGYQAFDWNDLKRGVAVVTERTGRTGMRADADRGHRAFRARTSVSMLKPTVLRALRDGRPLSAIRQRTGLAESTIWLLRREFEAEGHTFVRESRSAKRVQLTAAVLRAFLDGHTIAQVSRQSGMAVSTLWRMRREFNAQGYRFVGQRNHGARAKFAA